MSFHRFYVSLMQSHLDIISCFGLELEFLYPNSVFGRDDNNHLVPKTHKQLIVRTKTGK